jgi:hypothetical protein
MFDLISFNQRGRRAGYWRLMPFLKNLDESKALELRRRFTNRGLIVMHIPARANKNAIV